MGVRSERQSRSVLKLAPISGPKDIGKYQPKHDKEKDERGTLRDSDHGFIVHSAKLLSQVRARGIE